MTNCLLADIIYTEVRQRTDFWWIKGFLPDTDAYSSAVRNGYQFQGNTWTEYENSDHAAALKPTVLSLFNRSKRRCSYRWFSDKVTIIRWFFKSVCTRISGNFPDFIMAFCMIDVPMAQYKRNRKSAMDCFFRYGTVMKIQSFQTWRTDSLQPSCVRHSLPIIFWTIR